MDVVPGISDHDIVVVDSQIKVKSIKKPKRPIKQWSKADWETIRTKTAEFKDQFLNELQDHDVEINYSKFQKHVEDTLGKLAPTKMSSTRRNVPWITPAIRRMCRKTTGRRKPQITRNRLGDSIVLTKRT